MLCFFIIKKSPLRCFQLLHLLQNPRHARIIIIRPPIRAVRIVVVIHIKLVLIILFVIRGVSVPKVVCVPVELVLGIDLVFGVIRRVVVLGWCADKGC